MGIQAGLEPAIIPINTSLSGAVHLKNQRLFGLLMPAAWDAANLTFQASLTGNSNEFFDVYDDSGNVLQVTAAASRFIVLASPLQYMSLQRLIIRSGTAGSPVTQTAQRTIQLIPQA